MAKRKQTQIAIALAAGFLAASPALAVKDFSAAGVSGPNSSMSLYGSHGGIDTTSLGDPVRVPNDRGPVDAVASVPEPAGWLLMLLGFGLLGAMTRRSNPHPMRDELIH